MSRTKGINSKKRKLRDHYATPEWCIHPMADALYNIIAQDTFIHPFYLCDIGAGDGRIADICKKKLASKIKTHCLLIDLVQAKTTPKGCRWLIKDFMKLNLDKLFTNKYMPKLFVSNPPFSASNKIVFKTVEYLNTCQTGLAVFLLRVNWLGSTTRSTWLQANPPQKLLVVTPRPSFTGKGTDASEYAWFMWSTSNMNLGNVINIIKKVQ